MIQGAAGVNFIGILCTC